MKRINLNTIWSVPLYLPDIQPTLTDEVIQEAEQKIGFKFPKEYLDLLQIQNGGRIRFTLKGTPHHRIVGIGKFDDSITNFEWFKEYEEGLSFRLDRLFPFDGDGHWNICLDYRKNDLEPEITYVDTEIEFEKPIAKTFKEYLDLLEIETENGFAIETEISIENFVDKVSKLLNVHFEEPNSFHYGYKEFRTRYHESWIWISPNKVPSSFVRENNERYEELKSVIVTETLRFPEVPKNYLIINVSDEAEQNHVFKILEREGFIINDLRTYFDNSPNR